VRGFRESSLVAWSLHFSSDETGEPTMRDSNPALAEQSSSPSEPAAEPATKKKRGFATMNPDQVRELARRGGAAAHRAGTAHEFNSDEARAAGRKGGLAAHGKPPSTENHLKDVS
jgi:uncharacterized protein